MIKELILRFLHLLRKINNSVLYPRIFLNVGNNVEIRSNVFFDSPKQIFIGNGCFINRGCEFHIGYNKTSSIKLGDNVFLGMNVLLTCVGHVIGDSRQRAGVNKYSSIIIGNGTWIGANSTILQGVTVGDGVIVAAGSVVISDIPSNTMVGGVPARFIKSIDDINESQRIIEK